MVTSCLPRQDPGCPDRALLALVPSCDFHLQELIQFYAALPFLSVYVVLNMEQGLGYDRQVLLRHTLAITHL